MGNPQGLHYNGFQGFGAEQVQQFQLVARLRGLQNRLIHNRIREYGLKSIGAVCLAGVTQTQAEPIKPSTYWKEIPPTLEAIILRCLARKPADRFASATELAQALAQLRG